MLSSISRNQARRSSTGFSLTRRYEPRAAFGYRATVIGTVLVLVLLLSIMPTMVSGNTNASVIMIAEKGVDMIKAALPSGRELQSLKERLRIF